MKFVYLHQLPSEIDYLKKNKLEVYQKKIIFYLEAEIFVEPSVPQALIVTILLASTVTE